MVETVRHSLDYAGPDLRLRRYRRLLACRLLFLLSLVAYIVTAESASHQYDNGHDLLPLILLGVGMMVVTLFGVLVLLLYVCIAGCLPKSDSFHLPRRIAAEIVLESVAMVVIDICTLNACNLLRT
ncbi:MAG: hypothetical protein JWM57_3290 [Phycisphaerales bacterium]|nr:hypothetical protein [Phycisphaerales bacterium]